MTEGAKDGASYKLSMSDIQTKTEDASNQTTNHRGQHFKMSEAENDWVRNGLQQIRKKFAKKRGHNVR